jgi:hypothetical protein
MIHMYLELCGATYVCTIGVSGQNQCTASGSTGWDEKRLHLRSPARILSGWHPADCSSTLAFRPNLARGYQLVVAHTACGVPCSSIHS